MDLERSQENNSQKQNVLIDENVKLREELNTLERRFKELEKRITYGLVWEEYKEPEEIVMESKNTIPLLKEYPDKAISQSLEDSVSSLIMGDNYYALSTLLYTHKNKVDAIYIDPPYNTGAEDWRYNNRFIKEDNRYRHSLWLNFMKHRLVIAKDLLTPAGVICVTIDDHELPTLWLLLMQIFGPDNHLGTVVIRNSPIGRKTQRKIAQTHEYALFFGRSQKSTIKNIEKNLDDKSHKYVQDEDGSWYLPTNLRKQGVDSQAKRRDETYKERWYPIYFDPDTGRVSAKEKLKGEIWPIDKDKQERIWRRSKDDIDAMYEAGEAWFKNTKNGPQIYYKFRGGISGEPPKSIWVHPKFSASEYGTAPLTRIMGERETFPFPKSVEAVKECIKVMTDNKDAVILDFFAGSGTTGQAVYEMNETDGGHRKFILCTNNENEICESVTYPRLSRVINGYDYKGPKSTILYETKISGKTLDQLSEIAEIIGQQKKQHADSFDSFEIDIEDQTLILSGKSKIEKRVEGIGGNLRFYTTKLLDVGDVYFLTDEQRLQLTLEASETIAFKEETFDYVNGNEWWHIFKSDRKCTAVYFREDKRKMKDLLDILRTIGNEIVIYVFSWGENEYSNEFVDEPNIRVEDIPKPLIDVYIEINKISHRR